MDLDLGGGRTLHVYDAGGAGDLVVIWHHGSPNIGAPPEPLLPAAAERGMRWVSYDRPAYGGSTRRPGRDVASAAADVALVAEALRIDRFAVVGHSGGAPHALACAAALPDRVLGVVAVSGLAPLAAGGLDWFAGMGPASEAQLRAAVAGRAALEHYLASAEFDPELFTPADRAALEGTWSWLGAVAGAAVRCGPDGLVDDNLAYVSPWGFDPAHVGVPVLLVHGGQDRIVPSAHGTWLGGHVPSAELWLRPDDGHISVLSSGVAALDWLREHAGPGGRAEGTPGPPG